MENEWVWVRDLAHRVHSSRHEVVDVEEGFHDVGPLDVGVHACDMDWIESSAVLEVHNASILNAVMSDSNRRWAGVLEKLRKKVKNCNHAIETWDIGGCVQQP